MHCLRKPLNAIIVGAAFSLVVGEVNASGFALIEQNASGLGNAYSGVAAAADDASTIYFNPAGMSSLPNRPQVVSALHLIRPSSKFQNANSRPALGQPLGSNGGDASDIAPVPNLYVALPLINRIHVGVGINGPFGLTTEYDSDWVGRFQAIKSEVKAINVNPSISYKVSEQISIGAGVSYQRLEAELTNAVNLTGAIVQGALQAGLIRQDQIPQFIAGQNAGAYEGQIKVEGDDASYGWNVGVLFHLDKNTRLGASYRSKIKYEISGSASFSVPDRANLGAAGRTVLAAARAPGAPLSDGPLRADIEMPDLFSVSIFHNATPKVDFMADVSWTGWSSVEELKFVRSTGTVLSRQEFAWDDTWRFSAGINYRLDNRLMLRAGVAFDQSPVPDRNRTPRLPDNDRAWIALGLQYKFSPQLVFDVGYVYIRVREPKIENRDDGNPNGFGVLDGKYKSNVNILSAQLAYTF